MPMDSVQSYLAEYKPVLHLFHSLNGAVYISRSVQTILLRTPEKAGIVKSATVPTFRHGFAALLLEQGNNLRYIQALLGHASSKTIAIYTHVSTRYQQGIINPLDALDGELPRSWQMLRNPHL